MKSFIDMFRQRRVAVIGDVMLDRYLWGSVSRISPEAPVPVMLVSGESSAPGGAANVAANLASLGVPVRLVGLTGADGERDDLLACLVRAGEIDCGGLIASRSWRTITKLRVVGAHQQIVRVDREDSRRTTAPEESELLAAALTAIEGADLVIFSDYGKGVCSDRLLKEAIGHARALGKTVIVDPKRTDLSAYRGASFLTPNRKELTDATGLPCETDDEAAAAAAVVREACGADVVLTRSEKGISLFGGVGEAIHLATVAQDVFDVSGAGDTVVAVLAAALSVDLPVHDALRLANHAAGIVVAKVGTATVTPAELLASINEEALVARDGSLFDRDDLIALRRQWEAEKFVVGFTNGCFDLLHPGHIALLRQAAGACDRLIVAINSDASVGRLKGPSRPVQHERARAEVMGAIKGVAAVTIFDEDTPYDLIKALQPDILVKGADYGIDAVVGADIVSGRGGRVILATLVDGQSTTGLISKSSS